ncbi:MAG: cupin domain-containing protein [Flavobacteriales bacterium]|nr:cupin domain-containing protein [Flavobacteriales bacterium]MCB9447171.1 cupin domain-containing protein [Flavobacteriales bacterium]
MTSFLNLSELKEWETIPGYKVKFVHTRNMTIAYYDVKAGSPFPEHSHVNEQVSTIIRGKFELVIEGESRIMTVGDVAVIPSGARHFGKALTDCRIMDVFYPVREDYAGRFKS